MSKAKEFVELAAEVVEQFKNQQMQDWATPDVIQRIATSLFIDANLQRGGGRSNSARPGTANNSGTPSGDIETVTGTVEEKESKSIDTVRGKGKKYAIKVNGRWYSTFNAKAFSGTAIEEGDEVKVYFKMNGKFANLEKVEAVGGSSDEEPDDIPF